MCYVYLIPQASNKRSAQKLERRKQEPKGDSTPDPPRKRTGSARNGMTLGKLQAGSFTKQTARNAEAKDREEREGATPNK
jgi:hypothetical protein